MEESKTAGRMIGLLYLAGAAGVFVVCSIVQGLGDSNMFSTSYAEPDSAILDLLMNVTFYPGWMVTGALAIGGVVALFTGNSD